MARLGWNPNGSVTRALADAFARETAAPANQALESSRT